MLLRDSDISLLSRDASLVPLGCREISNMASVVDPQAAVIEILVVNGVAGQNSRAALRELDTYKTNPTFVQTVSALVASRDYPVAPQQLSALAQQCGWPIIRDVAAWLLKTCIGPNLTFEAQAAAATAALGVLQEEDAPRRLTSAAAVVIARLTGVNGLDWKDANNLSLSDLLLNQMLGSGRPSSEAAALRTLQYLVEDAANSLGAAVATVVQTVAGVASSREDAVVRALAVEVLYAVFEFGQKLDWCGENLSTVQQGLCQGAPHAMLAVSALFANFDACTNETRAHAFKIATHLLGYLTHLERSPSTVEQLPALFNGFSSAAIAATASDVEPEVASAATDFIGVACNLFDKSAGEGSISVLCGYLTAALDTLVPNLLACMVMKPAEEEEMLANDHWSTRDPHVRKRNAKRKAAAAADAAAGGGAETGKAGAKDDDDMCAEATLRNSACIALESLSLVEPDGVSTLVVNNVQHVFSSNSWRDLEVGICALGAIYQGCQDALIPLLPNLIPSVRRAVGTGEPDAAHHIATISISLWCLSKFSEYAMLHDEGLYDLTVAAALPALTSSSKRVQSAAITFFRNTLALCLAIDPQSGGPMAKHLGSLMEKLNTCLPVYHTNNLALLCFVVQALSPLMGTNAVGILPPFQAELQKRLGALQQTMASRYQQGDIRVSCDTDAFEVGAVTSCLHSAIETSGEAASAAAQEISTWIEVIKYALQCEAQDDDTSLFHSPIALIVALIPAVDDGTLGSLLAANNNELVRIALHIAAAIDDDDVKSSSCSLVYELLGRFGPQLLPVSVDELLNVLASFGTVADHPVCVADSALVVTKLFEVVPMTENLARFATILGRQVRGDTVGNDQMVTLAQCVGICMLQIPQHFDLHTITETCYALRRSMNDEYKAQATRGLGLAFGALAQSSGADLPFETLSQAYTAYFKLALSWQHDCKQYDLLQRTIAATLALGTQHQGLSQVLQHELSPAALPAKAIKMMRELYGL
jgi:hypothetical protein